jgi:hypothetical protein
VHAHVTRKHTWKHDISTEDLTRRHGLDTADFYVARRQLGWLGHVARMDYSRLPRRIMLSCWVAHPRPRGAPRMTYGRSVGKALDTFGLDHNKWPELAADRLAWRAMLRSGEPPPDYRAPSPTPAALPIALTRAEATHGGHQRRHPELHAAARCDDAARREEKDPPQLSSSFRTKPQPKPSL